MILLRSHHGCSQPRAGFLARAGGADGACCGHRSVQTALAGAASFSSSSSCYSSAGERWRCLECGKTKDTPSLGGSLQNTMLPAPHIREEQLHTKTQLCPPRLCPLPASRFVQLPHPQTPSTPRQLRPGGRKRGAHLPEAPGVGSRAPLAPPAAIDSVRSRRGVTAHFAGQLGFTIACSRGNPIQNNRLFFGEQTSVF